MCSLIYFKNNNKSLNSYSSDHQNAQSQFFGIYQQVFQLIHTHTQFPLKAMLPTNVLLAKLAILFIIQLTSNLSAVDASPGQLQHITDPKMNYTIKGDDVILHSLIGDIKIPMPDYAKASLRRENSKTKRRRVVRQLFRQNPNINYNINPYYFPDFFECNEQAQIALSTYSENHRYWEAFFKRNTINDTMAVSRTLFFFLIFL